MLTVNHAQTAEGSLTDSDRDFAAGDTLLASGKLWEAAAHAILAVAQQRGLEYGTHRTLINFARQVAEEEEEERLHTGILAAQHFYSHIQLGTMEPDDIEYDRPLVHRFVALMLALLE